jgi:hypothetical protein
MCKLRLISTAFLTFFLIAFVGAAKVQAGKDCTVLIGKTYNCVEKSDYYFDPIDDTWEFSGNEDGKLSLHSPVYNVDYRCTCLMKGSLASPQFDNLSTSFLCGGLTTGYIGDAISGKVTGNGKKIKGQYFRRDEAVDIPDDTRIFECTEVP